MNPRYRAVLYRWLVTSTAASFVGLGTDIVSLILWVVALILVRQRKVGSWRRIATWSLFLLIVAQLLDLPLAFLNRVPWTPDEFTVVSLAVRLSAVSAVLELMGLAGLVAAVFRSRPVHAPPRRGREIS